MEKKMSDWTSILVEKLQYKDSILYIHCMTFYKKEENSEYYNLDVYYRKILKFKNFLLIYLNSQILENEVSP